MQSKWHQEQTNYPTDEDLPIKIALMLDAVKNYKYCKKSALHLVRSSGKKEFFNSQAVFNVLCELSQIETTMVMAEKGRREMHGRV